MSDHERFTQVAQRKWAIVSESLILLTKNERMSESLIFLSKSLIRSFLGKQTSDSLGNPMSEFPALENIDCNPKMDKKLKKLKMISFHKIKFYKKNHSYFGVLTYF